jgi:hypothetical protein
MYSTQQTARSLLSPLYCRTIDVDTGTKQAADLREWSQPGRKTPLRDPVLRKCQSGVEVRCSRPFRPLGYWQFDKDTQRKILVVDASMIFTGGVGIVLVSWNLHRPFIPGEVLIDSIICAFGANRP